MTEAVTPGVRAGQTGSQTPRLSVVIPVYNEGAVVSGLADDIEDALAGLYRFEVIWVDDGSADSTADRIDELATRHDHHVAIHLRGNFGQSAAMAAGFDAASGEIVCPMDGDGQNDPADIPRLVDDLQARDLDCVSGRRRDRQDPLAKRIPSRIQTALAKATGPDIHDFGCTLKAYRAEALAEIDLRGEGHRYIPAKLYHKRFDVGEIDVNHRERAAGSSHYGVGRLVRGFVDLVWHWFWVRFSTRPMHLLGGLGVVMLAVGVGVGSWSVVQRFAFGVALGPRLPRLLFVALSIMSGLLVIGLGLISEMLTAVWYRDERAYRIEEVVE